MVQKAQDYGIRFAIKTSGMFMQNQKFADEFFNRLRVLKIDKSTAGSGVRKNNIHISVDKYHKNCTPNAVALSKRIYKDPKLRENIAIGLIFDAADSIWQDKFKTACSNEGMWLSTNEDYDWDSATLDGHPIGVFKGEVLKCGRAAENNIGTELPPNHILDFYNEGTVTVRFKNNGMACLETCGPSIEVPYTEDKQPKPWSQLKHEFSEQIMNARTRQM